MNPLFHFIILTIQLTIAFKYALVFDDERISKPCPEARDCFDFSNVTFWFQSEEEIIIDGNLTAICEVDQNDILTLKLSAYQMVRGEYSRYIATIVRKNLCLAVFNPVEPWYHLLKAVEKEYRKCPPTLGDIFPLKNYSTKGINFNLPDPTLSGAYRVKVEVSVVGKKYLVMCQIVHFHLYRM